MPAPLMVSVPAEFAWVVEKAIREALVQVESLKSEPDESFVRDWKYEGEVATVAILMPAPREQRVDTELREVA